MNEQSQVEEVIEEHIVIEECDDSILDEYYKKQLKILNDALSEKIVHSIDDNDDNDDDDDISLVSYDSLELSFDENLSN